MYMSICFYVYMQDGIVHPSNTSLRDFAALCVREFLVWSIKQTSKKVRHIGQVCCYTNKLYNT